MQSKAAAATKKGGAKNAMLAELRSNSRQIAPDEQKKRERAVRRFRELDTEYRTSWLPTHEDIIDFIQPNRGRFVQTDTNRGTRKDNRVINNTATDNSLKLESAIDTSVCPESRDWFVVGLDNPLAMGSRQNREYCHDYQEAMFAALEQCGFYPPNRNAISDVVGPATGAVVIEEDDDTIARCTHVPIGQYRVAADSRGEVNVFCRVYTYTAAQMAEEFGPENCSITVRAALRSQRTQSSKFTVMQLIEPRADIEREHGKVDAKNLPWASIWLELGQGYVGSVVPGQSESSLPAGPLGLLRESGYHEQPFYVFRWNQIGQDAYGINSPGWLGLGDAKMLQDEEYAAGSILALLYQPPMNVPSALANASLLPDARNYLDNDQHVKFEPSYEVPHETLPASRDERVRVEQRLANIFFANVIFRLSGTQRPDPQKTATEIEGIKQEQLLQLGAVFGRISVQLRVALRRVAGIFGRAGRLPAAPQGALGGKHKLRIDFVNPLVTAQKAYGFTGMQQLINLEVQLGTAAKEPGTGKLNGDEIMETACDIYGLKPSLLFSDEQMAKKRAAAAASQQDQQAAASLPEAAGAIKDLSNVDPEKLRSTLARLGPQAQAQGSFGLN